MFDETLFQKVETAQKFIDEQVNEYYKVDSTKTKSLDSLIGMRKKLVTYNYRLTQIYAPINIASKETHAARRISINTSKLAFLESQNTIKKTISEAEMRAEIQNKEVYQFEYKLSAWVDNIEALLRRTETIIQAINQDISYLKDEKSYEMRGIGSQGA